MKQLRFKFYPRCITFMMLLALLCVSLQLTFAMAVSEDEYLLMHTDTHTEDEHLSIHTDTHTEDEHLSIYADTPTEAFIKRIYQIVLERGFDSAGLRFWSDGLQSHSETVANVLDGFFSSSEFAKKSHSSVQYIEIVYKTFTDYEPSAHDVAFWLDAFNEGFNRQHMLDIMIQIPEFASLCADYGLDVGHVSGAEGFVARMYKQVLNRRYDQQGFDYWVDVIKHHSQTGADIANSFLFGDEFTSRNLTHTDFITIAYNACLGHDVEDAERVWWEDLLESGITRRLALIMMTGNDEFEDLCDRYQIPVGQFVHQPDPDSGIFKSDYEIERKWVIDLADVPFSLNSAVMYHIDQSYLNLSPEIRIRKIYAQNIDYYVLTIKTDIDTNGLIRKETEYFISEDNYLLLLDKKIGNTINKTRYQVNVDQILYAIDVFHDYLDGLVYLEIEYESEEAAKHGDTLTWVIKDVTSDKRYKNQSLAMYGIPE